MGLRPQQQLCDQCERNCDTNKFKQHTKKMENTHKHLWTFWSFLVTCRSLTGLQQLAAQMLYSCLFCTPTCPHCRWHHQVLSDETITSTYCICSHLWALWPRPIIHYIHTFPNVVPRLCAVGGTNTGTWRTYMLEHVAVDQWGPGLYKL